MPCRQALAMLDEAEGGARAAKHQFLSGILHNAAKILDANADAPTLPAEALQALGLCPRMPTTAFPLGACIHAIVICSLKSWMRSSLNGGYTVLNPKWRAPQGVAKA